MAGFLQTGWTAASLLPSLAGGVWSVPSQPKPRMLLTKPNSGAMVNRATLLNKLLGAKQPETVPPKQPDLNPAVNSTSTAGFDYKTFLGKML